MPETEKLELVPVGQSWCLYDAKSNFLALANEPTRQIAEWFNCGLPRTEINRLLTAKYAISALDSKRFVGDFVSALESGDNDETAIPLRSGFSDSDLHLRRAIAFDNGLTVGIACESDAVFSTLAELLTPYPKCAEANTADHCIECFGEGGACFLFVDGVCIATEIAGPVAKRLILERMLKFSVWPDSPSAILHASAVEMAGKTFVFVGPCGAGKSTLAAYLVSQGAQLIADDLVALHSDGLRVAPFKTKSSFKQGSWEILSQQLDGFDAITPTTVNRFGQKVAIKFFDIASSNTFHGWKSVDRIVHVNWQLDAACQVDEITPEDNFERLIRTGSNIRGDGATSAKGIATLACQCPAIALTYGDLTDAKTAIFTQMD